MNNELIHKELDTSIRSNLATELFAQCERYDYIGRVIINQFVVGQQWSMKTLCESSF